MIAETPRGLYCDAGGFYVDPLEPVERAVITHAHADHARPGSAAYLCAAPAVPLLQRRLPGATIQGVPYGAPLRVGGVDVTFFPSGHILGAAQVRVGDWVISGDYKREPDPTCPPFEPVRCDVFVTEATYALPIYRWEDPALIAREIFSWWSGNTDKPSMLFCYVLGKAQRILAELTRFTEKAVYVHGAMEPMIELYRAAGVRMLPTRLIGETKKFAGELVVAPITARGSPWMKRFGAHESAFVSGEMRVRGTRRRRSFDRGFALSDHADWPGLLRTIRETGASRILCTHGHREALVRYLRSTGVDAAPIAVAAPVRDPEGD